MEKIVYILFGVLGGLFCILGATLGKNWFLRTSKARIFVRLFGETGAQIFYIILGVFLIVCGLFLAMS